MVGREESGRHAGNPAVLYLVSIFRFLIAVAGLGAFLWPASSAMAANASLATSTVDIAVGENGAATLIVGNQGGMQP